jgi:geranylgeranyl diphosphate synthase type II
MGLGGKRLRPLLTLLGANLYTDDIAHTYLPAIGVEVFHNFTLMHDDIMDNAPLRRGKPTVHAKWNTNTAILSGDAMMIQSYQLLAKTNPAHFAHIFQIFNQTH